MSLQTLYKTMIKQKFKLFSLAILLIFSHALFAETFGFVEKVALNDKYLLKAKLDTGAKSASLDAIDITISQEDKQKWVNFSVPIPEGKIRFKEKLIGYVRIKVRTGEKKVGIVADAVRRPLVKMPITLGGQTKLIKVNLTNRENFFYPLLLGRDALISFGATINPALTFTQDPKVKNAP